MSPPVNDLGQPVGAPVPGWSARPRPRREALAGRFCRLEPLAPDRHAADLFDAYAQDTSGAGWTYLVQAPFEKPDDFERWLAAAATADDPFFYAVVEAESAQALGLTSYLRIDPDHGVIEVGNIHYSPALQRTAAATEAMYLMMRYAFDDLGYRRYEWKCDALNAPSRRAALRLGFSFEGIFRQALVYKGRNRDTAWYSLIDADWPARRRAFEAWLAPDNFDAAGRQRRALDARAR